MGRPYYSVPTLTNYLKKLLRGLLASWAGKVERGFL